MKDSKFEAKVSERKGSKYSNVKYITIPKNICDQIDLQKGDKIEVIIKKTSDN